MQEESNPIPKYDRAFTLLEGDCLDIMPMLEPTVDAIITDLPYGTTQCAWDSTIPLNAFWREILRLLKPDGAFITTASQPFTTTLISSNPDFFGYELVWRKSNPTGWLDANRKPLRAHENVLVFYRQQPTYNPQMRPGAPYRAKRRSGQPKQYNAAPCKESPDNTGTRYPISVLDFPNPNADSLHPTQKPVALFEWLVRTYTNPDEVVLDPCMGSGTTGVACAQTGRRFVGIEMNPQFFGVAEERVRNAQLPLFVEGKGE